MYKRQIFGRPNSTGQFNAYMFEGDSFPGMALAQYSNNRAFNRVDTDGAYFGYVLLNLARSNNIFGNSLTVQPSSLRSLALIRAY